MEIVTIYGKPPSEQSEELLLKAKAVSQGIIANITREDREPAEGDAKIIAHNLDCIAAVDMEIARRNPPIMGTIYDRLSMCVDALRTVIIGQQLSIRGHPLAIRPFALCFDATRHPGRSISEIVNGPKGEIEWRGVLILQDGRVEQRDRLWLEINFKPALVVGLTTWPEVLDTCPPIIREAVQVEIDAKRPKVA